MLKKLKIISPKGHSAGIYDILSLPLDWPHQMYQTAEVENIPDYDKYKLFLNKMA